MLESIEEDTGETPSALERRPELVLAADVMLFEAFMVMHMMRGSTGFGPAPITFDDIERYERRFGKLPVDNDILVRLIKKCDEVAMEWLKARMKANSNV